MGGRIARLTQLMKITALVVVGGVLMDQEIIQIVMEEPRPILPNEEGVVINPGEDLKAENRILNGRIGKIW
ncbi:hypothetical protein A2379_05065 [Candidatus Amesbacteria bacterium RIFOXYB1_FULL_47_13]|nr:MAG: hypothetical protein A2379_05065 [Candidatus Amesbacteria bacterium RIFOXYB1_FULL_47_13]